MAKSNRDMDLTIELDIVDHTDPDVVESLRRANLVVKHLGLRRTPYACRISGSPTDIVYWCAAHGYTEITFCVGIGDNVGGAL